MRKLSPTKAISHALNSVWRYRGAALRIAFAWAPVLLVCGIIEFFLGPPNPNVQETLAANLARLATAFFSILAICSMAVSWHRFILRDEWKAGPRLDSFVLHYAGNTLLIVLAMTVPSFLFLAAADLAPATALIGLPAMVFLIGAVIRVSIKLPAVALGDKSFSFRDAWKASEGNFWPILGVFLLSAAITAAGILILIITGVIFASVNTALGQFMTLMGAVLLQLFFGLFNASIFTSLYGYFVERREF